MVTFYESIYPVLEMVQNGHLTNVFLHECTTCILCKRVQLSINLDQSGYMQQNIDPSEYFNNSYICVGTTFFLW